VRGGGWDCAKEENDNKEEQNDITLTRPHAEPHTKRVVPAAQNLLDLIGRGLGDLQRRAQHAPAPPCLLRDLLRRFRHHHAPGHRGSNQSTVDIKYSSLFAALADTLTGSASTETGRLSRAYASALLRERGGGAVGGGRREGQSGKRGALLFSTKTRPGHADILVLYCNKAVYTVRLYTRRSNIVIVV
jgi:hypothetical protein